MTGSEPGPITDEELREPGNGFRMLVPGDLVLNRNQGLALLVITVGRRATNHRFVDDDWVVELLPQGLSDSAMITWRAQSTYRFLVDPASNRLIRDGWYTQWKVVDGPA